MDMDVALTRLQKGEIGFGEFTRSTSAHWKRLARKLLRTWRLPTWVVEEDVVQDLYLAAWETISTFDPARGKTLREYVVWNAFQKAKKRVHKARGCNQHRRNGPSRFETPLSVYDNDESRGPTGHDSRTENRVLDTLREPASQLDRIIAAESLQNVEEACETPGEVFAVRALVATGCESLADAAAVLYEDPNVRRILRIDNEDHAERIVGKAIRRLASAVAA